MRTQDHTIPELKAVFPSFEGFGPAVAPERVSGKRVLDFTLALFLLLLALPLLALITLAILADSRGPVLFAQRRVGLTGKPFAIFKFRSMHVLEDGADIVQAAPDDARITRVGRYLRASSLDELPQLINVLAGTMSLVGPRPHAAAHDDYYAARIANYRLRHLVKPGITGWAQINGARGATPELNDMQTRVDLDLFYVEHESLALDLKILVRTPIGRAVAPERILMRAAINLPLEFEPFREIPAPANEAIGEVSVGGLKTACLSRAGLARQMLSDCLIARDTPDAHPKLVFASNGHAIAMAAQDHDFRALFEQADLVHADGQAAVFASRLTATPIPERSATTDFIHDAAAVAATHGLRFFLLGATEEANAKAAEILKNTYPGLQIVGRRHGYFGLAEEDEICDEINLTKADVIWVGLSVPLEYEFAVRNKSRLNAGWLVTCGGCYNFITGAYTRAPNWMQACGLEWLHRLIREPKRLFWRYAVTNPVAIFLLLTRTNALPAGAVAPNLKQKVRAAA